jgi:branched-chain amino acid transport system permease protein
MDYVIYLATLTAFFIGLAVALRVLVGMCGVISVCHAAFFGFGAYAAVLTERWTGVPPLFTPFLVFALGATLGSLIARTALRIRDDYLVIFTLAVQLIFTNLLRNGGHITGGPAGIANIGPLINAVGELRAAVLPSVVAAMALCLIAISVLLDRAPFGQALRAMRDDEVFARSVGKDTPGLKTSAFALSTAMASAIGAIYPHFTGFIDPSQFTINQSIAMLSMVIIGGASRISGAVLGATLLVLIPEALRSVAFSGAVGNLRQIALGALLTLIVMFRPGGVIGEDIFSKRRH